MSMTPRERLLTALRHQEPDRIPIDLGGTDVSTIMVGPYVDLARRLGVAVDPIYLMDPKGQLVYVNDTMRETLGIDTTIVHPQPREWYCGEAYDDTPVMVPDRFRPQLQADGSRVLPGTSIQMVSGGCQYVKASSDHPLQNIHSAAEIDRFIGEIEAFEWPDWFDLDWNRWEKQAKDLAENTDRGISARFNAHIFQAGQLLRGWNEFLLDLATDPALAEALMDRLAQAHIEAFDRFAAGPGRYVDVIELTDDLGMQNNLWLRPDMYRQHVKLYHTRLVQHIKQTSDMFVLFHSDGAIFPLLPDLIEVGIDIINPVQYSAKGMDLAELKKEFGNDLVFWGAGIDTQGSLPFSTPQKIADEVKRNIDTLAPGGGFVFATVHNIIQGVPAANIEATFRTALEHGTY